VIVVIAMMKIFNANANANAKALRAELGEKSRDPAGRVYKHCTSLP
jgi:hypothetical protein